MKLIQPETLSGTFQHLIYSPRGEAEGALLQVNGAPLQAVLGRHDPDAALAFDGVAPGQAIVIQALRQGPSSKGVGEHPVYDFVKLSAVDGKKPVKRKPQVGAAYRGKVIRFNYARHGAANGVVLDSGDFIHTKPEGMVKLRLKLGDMVQADGDAQRLADDAGWAVAATKVNGKTLA